MRYEFSSARNVFLFGRYFLPFFRGFTHIKHASARAESDLSFGDSVDTGLGAGNCVAGPIWQNAHHGPQWFVECNMAPSKPTKLGSAAETEICKNINFIFFRCCSIIYHRSRQNSVTKPQNKESDGDNSAEPKPSSRQSREDAITTGSPTPPQDPDINSSRHGSARREKSEGGSSSNRSDEGKKKTPRPSPSEDPSNNQWDFLASSMAKMAQSVSGMSAEVKGMSKNVSRLNSSMETGMQSLVKACHDMQTMLTDSDDRMDYEEGDYPDDYDDGQGHNGNFDRGDVLELSGEDEPQTKQEEANASLSGLQKLAATPAQSTNAKTNDGTSVLEILAGLQKQVDCEEETGTENQYRLADIVNICAKMGSQRKSLRKS